MNDRELIEELAKHLKSALRVIAEDHDEDFHDDQGDEMPRECGGNYALTSFSNTFGKYDFDWREAEQVLNIAGEAIDD